MQCDYYDAGVCTSCTWIEVPYRTQVRQKQARIQRIVDPALISLRADPHTLWEAPAFSPEAGFRNKAKMVVTGTWQSPKLGILDPHQHPKHHDGTGVDLSECPLYEPGIVSALEPVARTITAAQLQPYDVASREGELKHVILTISPQQELLIRFVLRSTRQLSALQDHLGTLREQLTALQVPAAVITANILPEHQALLEGDREIHLVGEQTLTMLFNGIPLRLRPQGFFQTNTVIAAELYAQSQRWIDELPGRVSTVWDLYAGVGGFGLSLATTHQGRHRGEPRRVWGIETSQQAIAAAQQTVTDLGLADSVRFVAGDATSLAREQPGNVPDLVVVNPPRRGIGEDLARWINSLAGTGQGRVKHVLYSSCNPITLARDLAHLGNFVPVRARLLDMFPHTDHAETLLLLSVTQP